MTPIHKFHHQFNDLLVTPNHTITFIWFVIYWIHHHCLFIHIQFPSVLPFCLFNAFFVLKFLMRAQDIPPFWYFPWYISKFCRCIYLLNLLTCFTKKQAVKTDGFCWPKMLSVSNGFIRFTYKLYKIMLRYY